MWKDSHDLSYFQVPSWLLHLPQSITESHISSAETVRIPGAFRMLHQMIFLARLQISEI